MKYTMFSLLVLTWWLPLQFADAQTTGVPINFKAFSQQLDSLRQKNHIPGLSVAVVKDNQVVFAKGYGFSDDEGDVATTPETAYWLASVTKTFVGLLFLQLEAAGRLDLNDKIADDPSWGGFCQRLSQGGGIFGKNLDCARDIRLKHVLSHTVNGPSGEQFRYNPVVFSRLSRYLSFKLDAKPQPVSGVHNTLAKLTEQYILGPAQMTNTMASYYQREKSHVLINLAQGLKYTPDGEFEKLPNPDWDMAGGAGIISTVLDLAKYDIALNQNKIVSPVTKQKLFSPAVTSTGKKLPYAVGWYVQDYMGKPLIWHAGWDPDPGFSALYLKIPAENATLILLANSEGLHWETALDKAEVEKSPFAQAFLELFPQK